MVRGSYNLDNGDAGVSGTHWLRRAFERYTSTRWRVGYVCILQRVCQITIRLCMSVAVVCMAEDHLDTPFRDIEKTVNNITIHEVTNFTTGEFSWSEEFIGIVLSSYYYGRLTCLLGGYVTAHVCSKTLLSLFTFLAGVFTVLCPVIVRWNKYGIIGARVLAGACLGMTTPAVDQIFSKWFPQRERGRVMTWLQSGTTIAVIITFGVTGSICYIPVDNGWPFYFYIPGAFSIIWVPLCYLCVFNSPQEHPRISPEEKLYIHSRMIGAKVDSGNPASLPRTESYTRLHRIFSFDNLGNAGFYCDPPHSNHTKENGYVMQNGIFSNENISKITGSETDLVCNGNVVEITMEPLKKQKVPWCKLLSSPAVWAFLISNMATEWYMSMALSYLPTFLNEVLKYDLDEDGFMSAVPFVGGLIMVWIMGYLSDHLITKSTVSVQLIRKVIHVTGCLMASGFTIGVAYGDSRHENLPVILLTLAIASINMTNFGSKMNHFDIAPSHAGALKGLAIAAKTISTISAPLLVGFLVNGHTIEEWRRVFCIGAGMLAVSAVCFAIFSKGKEQKWAKRQQHEQVVKTVAQ